MLHLTNELRPVKYSIHMEGITLVNDVICKVKPNMAAHEDFLCILN